jgi:phosphate transport system permease protein
MSKHWHQKRLRAEKRFRFYGILALTFAVIVLVGVVGTLTHRGYTGFIQTQIVLPIIFDATIIGLDAGQDVKTLPVSGFNRLAQQSIKNLFPEVTDVGQQRKLTALISGNNGLALKNYLLTHPEILAQSTELPVVASSNVDLFIKGKTSESDRRLSDEQVVWLATLSHQDRIKTSFNTTFFTQGDSRSPEQAGFLGAIVGSLLTLVVCLLWVFPIGVMTAVYLEEFARKSRFVDFIEVNINNLAAVPSIVFGLLGLAVYINFMGMPRSAPLVGGLTLALMVLPVIIISTRTALAAIPGSIRDAARALGASPVQVVWHHVLPLSMPGIMTGTILGLARAIGETAPLLMIGMVAFVADVPSGFTSAATAMPVQIYLWASSAEAGFVEKTAAGILLLLVLLMALNALAIILRKKFEVRW